MLGFVVAATVVVVVVAEVLVVSAGLAVGLAFAVVELESFASAARAHSAHCDFDAAKALIYY